MNARVFNHLPCRVPSLVLDSKSFAHAGSSSSWLHAYLFNMWKTFEIYNYLLLKLIMCCREVLNSPACDAIHITEVNSDIECDTFIPAIDFSMFQPWYSSFPLVENNICYCFATYVRVKSSLVEPSILEEGVVSSVEKANDKFEIQKFSFLPKFIFDRHEEYMYLRLVQDIISNGYQKEDRTGTGTLSKFGCQVQLFVIIQWFNFHIV